MTTLLRENLNLEALADKTDSVAAVLESDDATRNLARSWNAATDAADAQLAVIRKARRKSNRALAAREVAAVHFAETVAGFSLAAQIASNSKRDQPPYSDYFGEVSPSKLAQLGVADRLKRVKGWVEGFAKKPDAPLATEWSPKLSGAHQALFDRNAAVEAAESAHTLEREAGYKLVREINLAADVLEGDLKKLFPGQPARVAAFLSPLAPDRAAKKKKKDAPGGDGGGDNPSDKKKSQG